MSYSKIAADKRSSFRTVALAGRGITVDAMAHVWMLEAPQTTRHE
jgi:hypothetical protein